MTNYSEYINGINETITRRKKEIKKLYIWTILGISFVLINIVAIIYYYIIGLGIISIFYLFFVGITGFCIKTYLEYIVAYKKSIEMWVTIKQSYINITGK